MTKEKLSKKVGLILRTSFYRRVQQIALIRNQSVSEALRDILEAGIKMYERSKQSV